MLAFPEGYVFPDLADVKIVEEYKFVEDMAGRYGPHTYRIAKDLGTGSHLSWEAIKYEHHPYMCLRMYNGDDEVHIQRFLDAPIPIRRKYVKDYLEFCQYLYTSIGHHMKDNKLWDPEIYKSAKDGIMPQL